jgi:hypothetical protein
MGRPRRSSRPDHSDDECHRKNRRPSYLAHYGARDGFDLRYADDLQSDSGQLIETAFLDRNITDDPETYLIAWLAVLEQPDDAPCAAACLANRLQQMCSGPLSDWQRRLIDLLFFVASHRRRSSSDAHTHPYLKPPTAKD